MSQVAPNQTWGIGDIAGAEFKGGWGPSPSGKYLVRQIGVLTTPAGKVAVAIAAKANVVIDVLVSASAVGGDRLQQLALSITNSILGKIPG